MYSKDDIVLTFEEDMWWAEIPGVICAPGDTEQDAIDLALLLARGVQKVIE